MAVADLKPQVEALRAQGLGYVRIGRELGIGATSVRRLLDPEFAERQRRMSHDAKRRRVGVCERCGAETRYNGKTTRGPSSLCKFCGEATNADRGVLKRGTGTVGPLVLDYLEQPRRHGEVARHAGITAGYASDILHRLRSYGLIRRVSRGVYVRVEK